MPKEGADELNNWLITNGVTNLFPACEHYQYQQSTGTDCKWGFLFQVGLFDERPIPELMNKLIFGKRANDTTLKVLSSKHTTMPGIALAWLMRGLVDDSEILTFLRTFTFDANMPRVEWRKELRSMPKDELLKLLKGDVLRCLLMR
jgi:hypothetical protein